MSKMSELDAAVSEIRRCGEALIELSASLREIFGEANEAEPEVPVTQEPETTEPAEPEKPVVTLEQVRSVLAEKSAAGKRVEVQTLIQKYGATKLSAISPDNYASLLADAEVL